MEEIKNKTEKKKKKTTELNKFKDDYFRFYNDVKHYSKGHEDW